MAKTRNTISSPDISFKQRLSALKNLPEFFKLVWLSSPWKTSISFLLRIIRSAMPVALLYVGKLIIDQVVQLNRHGGNHNELWQLVAIEFGLAVLTDGLNRAINLLDSLLGDLFSNYTSMRIMRHAATLDLDQFEDSVFYDKLERARQQTVGRTVLLSQVMSQVQDFISMAFLITGLIAFNPWLILLLLIAIIPAFLGESYFNSQNYALTRSQTPERRELDYVRYLGASDETAKEVKIFGLADFVINRFKTLSDKFYSDNSKLAVRRSAWGTFFSILGSIGYYAAYGFIIYQTINGKTSVGSLTFLAGSFRQLSTLMESMLSRFTTVSQGAIYLNDFLEFFEIKPKITVATNPLPFPNPIKQGFIFE
ncbi:MAG: putative multidrug export ATP-binding/permease protein, partial [Mucilaginibacter sp.]|nr:putative multidrug export ATP-binding/permease protein [Mucilaginibacter sp.]